MRVRVLLTNGRQTRDLFWLEHTGKDVYFESAGIEGHDTYHRSGKRHHKSPQGYEHYQSHIPLQDLKGYFNLVTLNVTPEFLESGGFPEYRGGRADAVVYLDTRSMPKERMVPLFVGLLEPGRIDRLPIDFEPYLEVRQLLIVRSVTPWVVLTLCARLKLPTP